MGPTILCIKLFFYFVCLFALVDAFRRKRSALLALIPPFFLDCVVAIGVLTPIVLPDGTLMKRPDGTVQHQIQWNASGFLYGHFVERVDEKQARYLVYLVTNRHVIDAVIANSEITKNTVYLRFNPEAAEPAREFDLSLRDQKGTLNWFAHPCRDVDVAIVPINADFLKEKGIKFSFFQSENHVADRQKAVELGLSEGDGIYVLGFPMGIVGKERNFVVVRQGSIARIRDFLAGSTKDFLADAFVFPGNSGGPVVIKPEISAIKGTQPIRSSYLIGMIKGYLSYPERAVSEQTKRLRIIFEENSGLANVISIDSIKETIEEFQKPPVQRKTKC